MNTSTLARHPKPALVRAQIASAGSSLSGRVSSNTPAAGSIPRDAIPECKNGVTFDDYSRSLVVTRDRVTGVVVWTWYARDFLDPASLLQYPRSQWHSYAWNGDPRRTPTLESVALAAFVPGAGLFVSDRTDLPAACRRDAGRYFPLARRASQADIDAVHHSLAKVVALAWECAPLGSAEETRPGDMLLLSGLFPDEEDSPASRQNKRPATTKNRFATGRGSRSLV